jgi:hypothetical protein
MRDEIVDGGSAAFPTSNTFAPDGEMEHGRHGITVRDYFAARAMQALIPMPNDGGVDELAIARAAYAFADAMVKARQPTAQEQR